jgi:hypothetical protein
MTFVFKHIVPFINCQFIWNFVIGTCLLFGTWDLVLISNLFLKVTSQKCLHLNVFPIRYHSDSSVFIRS